MKHSFLAVGMALLLGSCVPNRKYTELLENKNRIEAENGDLSNENRTLSADNSQLKTDLETTQKRATMLQADTAFLGKRYRQMTAKFNDLNKLNDELLAKLNDLRSETDAENRKLVDVLRDTQEDLLEREDDLRELERQLGLKQKSLAELDTELKAREQRVQELEALIAEKDAAVKALKDRLTAALLGFKDKGLTVEQRDGKIYVSLQAQLLFASGSTTVNAEGKNALLDLANVVKTEKDLTILVEGHTDTDPFAGSGAIKDNWDLSVMRATSVVKILTNEGGVDKAMLTAAGRGEFMPVADNATAEGKAKNRRIEVILTPNLDELFEIINE